MSEENQQEESTLSPYEENWAIHQFCGIPYNEAKKIDDVSERQFLLKMAVVMKRAQEDRVNQEREKEQKLTEQFKGMIPNLSDDHTS